MYKRQVIDNPRQYVPLIAVLHIFEAKGRPQDNPLILHIPDVSWLTRYCEDVPDAAYRLAERFWPCLLYTSSCV